MTDSTRAARVAQDYETWGRARLTAFTQLLFQYGRARRLRGRRLYRGG
ncbi:MAG TPA: hypothetical protein VIK11_06300 [Tepidiformaceae bacterium]